MAKEDKKQTADIGLIGLAVMGQNLVLNMADNGYIVAVFNRTVTKVDDFLGEAANDNGWNPNFGGTALMWRGRCIIRSVFLGKIKEAFDKNPKLTNLLLDDHFHKVIDRCQESWRRVVSQSVQMGIPVPAFATALTFFDGYTV